MANNAQHNAFAQQYTGHTGLQGTGFADNIAVIPGGGQMQVNSDTDAYGRSAHRTMQEGYSTEDLILLLLP